LLAQMCAGLFFFFGFSFWVWHSRIYNMVISGTTGEWQFLVSAVRRAFMVRAGLFEIRFDYH
jgi:hypothetical protein